MKKFLVGAVLLAACGVPAGKAPQGAAGVPEIQKTVADAQYIEVPTTSTLAPPTTQMALPRPVQEEAPSTTSSTMRRIVTTTVVEPVVERVTGNDFWRALAICESSLTDPNYFQFEGGTGAKAGYVPGSSYEAQKAAAQRWAAIIHPNEGTSAGWPNCWWVALKNS